MTRPSVIFALASTLTELAGSSASSGRPILTLASTLPSMPSRGRPVSSRIVSGERSSSSSTEPSVGCEVNTISPTGTSLMMSTAVKRPSFSGTLRSGARMMLASGILTSSPSFSMRVMARGTAIGGRSSMTCISRSAASMRNDS